MEVKTKVETYKVEYKCDKCKDGYMIATGYSRGSNVHACTNFGKGCDTTKYFDCRYPYIEYRKVVDTSGHMCNNKGKESTNDTQKSSENSKI